MCIVYDTSMVSISAISRLLAKRNTIVSRDDY
jgi:hypothetical protein